MSCDKTCGSGPRELTGSQLFRLSFSNQRSRKSTEKTRNADSFAWSNLLCVEGEIRAFCLPDFQLPPPSPLIGHHPPFLSIVCVCMRACTCVCMCLSLTSLSRALFRHSEPFFSFRRQLSALLTKTLSPPFWHGHCCFPLASIGHHFRNYSQTSQGQKREEGEAKTGGRGGREWQMFHPVQNSCYSSWFLAVSTVKPISIVVHTPLPLPPIWSLHPIPGKIRPPPLLPTTTSTHSSFDWKITYITSSTRPQWCGHKVITGFNHPDICDLQQRGALGPTAVCKPYKEANVSSLLRQCVNFFCSNS